MNKIVLVLVLLFSIRAGAQPDLSAKQMKITAAFCATQWQIRLVPEKAVGNCVDTNQTEKVLTWIPRCPWQDSPMFFVDVPNTPFATLDGFTLKGSKLGFDFSVSSRGSQPTSLPREFSAYYNNHDISLAHDLKSVGKKVKGTSTLMALPRASGTDDFCMLIYTVTGEPISK
jgi:hypothetical protein